MLRILQYKLLIRCIRVGFASRTVISTALRAGFSRFARSLSLFLSVVALLRFAQSGCGAPSELSFAPIISFASLSSTVAVFAVQKLRFCTANWPLKKAELLRNSSILKTSKPSACGFLRKHCAKRNGCYATTCLAS